MTATTDALYLPLAVATHAFYGRPFKEQRGVGRLSKDYIPDDWRGIHQCLITFRDQLLIHTDAESITQAGRPLHDVVYHNVGSERCFSTSDPRPRLDYYRDVSRYLPRLIQKVKKDIDAIQDRFSQSIPTSEGHYQLNLVGGDLFSLYEPPEDTLTF